MDFAQAVYDRRSALGWSTAELAYRAGMSEEDIESIEESGVEPTLELIEQLATALESGARIDPRTSPEFRFEKRAARRAG
jgi:ribosome-binding protein aMBF1 (putative translation factor)